MIRPSLVNGVGFIAGIESPFGKFNEFIVAGGAPTQTAADSFKPMFEADPRILLIGTSSERKGNSWARAIVISRWNRWKAAKIRRIHWPSPLASVWASIFP